MRRWTWRDVVQTAAWSGTGIPAAMSDERWMFALGWCCIGFHIGLTLSAVSMVLRARRYPHAFER